MYGCKINSAKTTLTYAPPIVVSVYTRKPISIKWHEINEEMINVEPIRKPESRRAVNEAEIIFVKFEQLENE